MTEKSYKLAEVRKPEGAEDFTYFDIEEISEKEDAVFENLPVNNEEESKDQNNFNINKFTIRHNADAIGAYFSRDDGEKLPIEISA